MKKFRMEVILVPVIIFITLTAIGIVDTESFAAMLNTFFVSLMVNGSWLIALGTLAFIVFLIFILFHPIGSVRLGGRDAKPEYSL